MLPNLGLVPRQVCIWYLVLMLESNQYLGPKVELASPVFDVCCTVHHCVN